MDSSRQEKQDPLGNYTETASEELRERGGGKVKSHSRLVVGIYPLPPGLLGLWSHYIRHVGSSKPDCLIALQRKWPRSLAAAASRTLSPVRFRSGNREIAAFSSDFQGNAAGFLCDPDWMAERAGFEPSVRFWPA